jgi:cell wall assembly regulator SMI1
MKQSTLDLLNDFFARFPFMKGGVASSAEIDSAESVLGVRFSEDYREFLERFGGAIVGPYPLYGLRRPEPMDAHLWSVVRVTEYYRSQLWPGTDNWYVISMDHAGNPIGVDDGGKLLTFDHDAGETIEVALNLESYLVECLKN